MELRRYRAKELKDEGIQTEAAEVASRRIDRSAHSNRSSQASPAPSKQQENKLLEKISFLEETVNELKLEKSELISKINSMQPE